MANGPRLSSSNKLWKHGQQSNARQLLQHQMTGVGFDHQPDFAPRAEMQRIPSRQGEMNGHFDSAIHRRDHYHVTLLH